MIIKKIILAIFAFFSVVEVQASTQTNQQINIYLFHSDTCPHCQEEIQFLSRLEEKYPNIKIWKYEISEKSSSEMIEKAENEYNITIKSVPVTIIGDKVYTGFSQEKSPSKIITTIDYYNIYEYIDRLQNIQNETEIVDNPSLDEYLKKYSSYEILLGIHSEDLDISTSSILLGFKNNFNIINILTIFIVAILILNLYCTKQKILIAGFYILLLTFSQLFLYVNPQNLKWLTIMMIFFNFFVILLLILKKIAHIIKYILLILLISLNVYILSQIESWNNIIILKKIFRLNLVSNYQIIVYIIENLFAYLVIHIIILFGIYKIISIVCHRKTKKKSSL